jgi:hypothetical protein
VEINTIINEALMIKNKILDLNDGLKIPKSYFSIRAAAGVGSTTGTAAKNAAASSS